MYSAFGANPFRIPFILAREVTGMIFNVTQEMMLMSPDRVIKGDGGIKN